MARRKQIQSEIAAALAAGTPHPEATVSDWKKLIADIQKRSRATADPAQRTILQQELDAASAGLRAATKVAAHKPGYVTYTNLFALKSMVVQHGPEFPSRVDAVDAPHIRRTVQAGLVEVVGNRARLTPAGREAVADLLVQDIGRESSWQPRENAWLGQSPERRAEMLATDVAVHDAKVKRLEDTLAKLTR